MAVLVQNPPVNINDFLQTAQAGTITPGSPLLSVEAVSRLHHIALRGARKV